MSAGPHLAETDVVTGTSGISSPVTRTHPRMDGVIDTKDVERLSVQRRWRNCTVDQRQVADGRRCRVMNAPSGIYVHVLDDLKRENANRLEAYVGDIFEANIGQS